jgi:hypothetical protein
MKSALLIGCGSKFGAFLTNQLLDKGYAIYSISSSTSTDPNHLTVDWKTVNVTHLEKFLKSCPDLDLIFFNQNASALSEPCFRGDSLPTLELWKLEKSWSQSYFVSCILPFHIIHSLGNKCSEHTKVGWMLSTYVHSHPNNSNLGFADYIGNKYQNYVVIKNFSRQHKSSFFGINPDNLTSQDHRDTAQQLTAFLENSSSEQLNGKIFYYNGNEEHNFDSFTPRTYNQS